jgi:hypothetical protein
MLVMTWRALRISPHAKEIPAMSTYHFAGAYEVGIDE